jgi:hypothetical protein
LTLNRKSARVQSLVLHCRDSKEVSREKLS